METEYYDLFGVSPNATTAEIRKAYYEQAKQVHPDNNINDLEAAQKFKVLCEAYQVLGDESQRQDYDANGKANISKNEVIDGLELYMIYLGGDVFEEYIGQLPLASKILQCLFEVEEPDDHDKYEKLAKILILRNRIKLAEILRNRLNQYVQGDRDGFICNAKAEALKLSNAANGANMLNTIGYMYERTAAKVLGKKAKYLSLSRVSYTLDCVRHEFHFMKTVVTSLIGLASFNRLYDNLTQGTERSVGELIQYRKKPMADSMWKANALHIDNTLLCVCMMVLEDNSVQTEVFQARAEGLKILGKIFQ